MIDLLKRFIYGVYLNLYSVNYIKNIIIKRDLFYLYSKIIFINLILLTGINFICLKISDIIYNLTCQNYLIILYYMFYLSYNCLLFIFIYPFCYIWSMDAIGNLFKSLFNSKNNNYEIVTHKIYFIFLGLIFYLLSGLIYKIPIIGKYFGYIFSSFCYSYFCFEYASQFDSVTNYNKLIHFEKDFMFFLGYGFLYSILENYLIYLNFFTVFIALFPLSVCCLKYHYHYNLITETDSVIFYIPILILKYILLLLNKVLDIKYPNFIKSKN